MAYDQCAERLVDMCDEGEFMHYALEKSLSEGTKLKPWNELNEQQKAAIVLYVGDMSSWRAEGRVDPVLADFYIEHYSELREMLIPNH